jgi:hypothetical protein
MEWGGVSSSRVLTFHIEGQEEEEEEVHRIKFYHTLHGIT